MFCRKTPNKNKTNYNERSRGDNMLNIEKEVERGIIFLRLKGNISKKTFTTLCKEINYLLYKQGISNFVFDFTNIKLEDDSIFMSIQSKLVEIFLNCGKVVVCGLSEINKKKIGFTKDRLFYVNNNLEAFNYLVL